MRPALIVALLISLAALLWGAARIILNGGPGTSPTAMVLVGVAGSLIVCSAGSYVDEWRWTGFGPPSVRRKDGVVIPSGKTLWDVLQLVVIPGVFVFGVWWLNDRQTAASRISADRQATATTVNSHDQTRDSVLDGYLDHMSDLLLREGLSGSRPSRPARTVARARTLTALRRLDPSRMGLLMQFLSDSQLLTVIHLNGAYLVGAKLPGVDLRHALLSSTDMQLALLEGARLDQANLTRADLSGSNLVHATLNGAYLMHASLHRADLADAKLARADFTSADLSYTDLSNANLYGAALAHANLNHSDLVNAVLRHNLIGADLSNANFACTSILALPSRDDNPSCPGVVSTDLSSANLSHSRLRRANLANTDLSGADLYDSDLTGANLSGVDLTHANLKGAHLKGASLGFTVGLRVIFGSPTWKHTKCPDGTFSDTNGTQPQSCLGHFR